MSHRISIALPAIGIVVCTSIGYFVQETHNLAAAPSSEPGLIAQVKELQAELANLQSERLPTGTVIAFAGRPIPSGWLLCDGQSMKPGEYPELEIALSTLYGAGMSEDGMKTGSYNLPDYAGQFLRGVSLRADGSPAQTDGTLNDPDANKRTRLRGGTGNSNEVGTVQPAAVQKLFFNVALSDVSGTSLDRWAGGGDSRNNLMSADIPVKGTGSETRPKNISVYFIIKAGRHVAK